MNITVLADNNTLIDRYFLAEPGLSLLIEDRDIKILFDTGYSDIFIRNALKMGKTLNEIYFIVLSHSHLDHTWGLDHGTWSVIKHLYPKANIPVVQLSLDRTSSPEAHWELGRQLGRLRERGVLIVGSGNVVHNLGKVAGSRMHEVDYSYDWARDAADVIRGAILRGDDKALCEAPLSNRAALKLAIPTFEHYLPLLYVMGARTSEESLQVFNDHAVAGSLYMTSVALGMEG